MNWRKKGSQGIQQRKGKWWRSKCTTEGRGKISSEEDVESQRQEKPSVPEEEEKKRKKKSLQRKDWGWRTTLMTVCDIQIIFSFSSFCWGIKVFFSQPFLSQSAFLAPCHLSYLFAVSWREPTAGLQMYSHEEEYVSNVDLSLGNEWNLVGKCISSLHSMNIIIFPSSSSLCLLHLHSILLDWFSETE